MGLNTILISYHEPYIVIIRLMFTNWYSYPKRGPDGAMAPRVKPWGLQLDPTPTAPGFYLRRRAESGRWRTFGWKSLKPRLVQRGIQKRCDTWSPLAACSNCLDDLIVALFSATDDGTADVFEGKMGSLATRLWICSSTAVLVIR
jgi:hypothetical protein